MITSRLASKAQTTIPQPARAALRRREGDEAAYAIEPGRVMLTHAQPDRAADDPFRAFAESDSPADTEAYAGLEVWDLVKVPFPYATARRGSGARPWASPSRPPPARWTCYGC